ncbi:hypothetical protein [Duganella vulcania]|nr:hypothetical protein [Duganella vulcania]
MNIIGWIREGDQAACGGKVAEGLTTCTGHGVPYILKVLAWPVAIAA